MQNKGHKIALVSVTHLHYHSTEPHCVRHRTEEIIDYKEYELSDYLISNIYSNK